MIIKEEKRDLFSVDDDYYFAHCISADFGMGAGIAVEFNKRFDMKNKLTKKYKKDLSQYINTNGFLAQCILEGRTLNLITKEKVWHKPNYDTLTTSLWQMKRRIIENKIMPTRFNFLNQL
jgi:hypothetical protein